jgi:outer membrane receptor protein involved in Fe transport
MVDFQGITIPLFKSRPANEDNSIVAKGYAIADFNINYEYQSVTFGVSIENLLNTKWNETQFATESRLKKSLIVSKNSFYPEHLFLWQNYL